MNRLLAAALAAVCLAATCLAATAESLAAEPHTQDAAAAPAVAGEVLDLAIDNCRRGEREQAMALFQAILSQLDPPPPIRQLVGELQATGCDRAPIAERGTLRLQGGGGWDSNVSQGISARSLVLGSGDTTLELALDQSYRPRPTGYSQVAGDYTLKVLPLGIGLQVAAGARQNFTASDFDLATLSAAASKEVKLGSQTLRGQLDVSDIWLGGRSYLEDAAATVQWLRPDARGAWLATARDTLNHYLKQATQNSHVLELGILREQQLASWASVHAGWTLQRDDALGLRPGGDRSGWQAQLGGVLLVSGWRLQPELTYTRWDSAALFAPGLLDVHRRNRLRQVLVQAEKPIAPGTSVLLEWRGRWASDTVSLYRYQAQVLSATIIHRF